MDGLATCDWTEYRPGNCIALHHECYDTSELQADINQHEHFTAHRDTWQKGVLLSREAARMGLANKQLP